jgi:hypothetical protein
MMLQQMETLRRELDQERAKHDRERARLQRELDKERAKREQQLQQQLQHELKVLQGLQLNNKQQVEPLMERLRAELMAMIASQRAVGSRTVSEKGAAVVVDAGQPVADLFGSASGAGWQASGEWAIARGSGLKERGEGGVQELFTTLLRQQPAVAPKRCRPRLQFTDTHNDKSLVRVFGGMPAAVVHPMGRLPLASNIVALVELKRTGGVEEAGSLGQVALYAEHMLEHAVPPSRHSLLAAVTDLRTIKFVRVTRRDEASGRRYSYALSPASDDVVGALTWLACQEPAQLGVQIPSFVAQAGPAGLGVAGPAGPAAPAAGQELQVTGFLGSGATSEVYSALTAEGQVGWLGARGGRCCAGPL